jgi:hypothetical protein
MSDITTKPVHRIRYGNVSAAVWANNSQAGYFFNTTFQRVYKDGEIWGESHSFEDRDLPNLAKAAADAHTWIYQQKANATIVCRDNSALQNGEYEGVKSPESGSV